MLHAKPRPSRAPDPVKLLDVQLSALIFLLARCVHRPCDGASAQLALDHLEMLSRNREAGALLRQTAARLANQWSRRLDAAVATGPLPTSCPAAAAKLH
jgi:hypothetical protein